MGIDVVDLGDPRCRGKASDRRFVRRVLAPAEATALERAADPDRELWRFWAAKEAAFKVVSKLVGEPPPFVHAAFEVTEDGRVRWRDREVPVRLQQGGEALVALAWEPPGEEGAASWEAVLARELDPDPDLGLEELVLRHLQAAERPPVHSRPSALVRMGARRALSRALGVEEARLSVVCPGGPAGRTPPVVHLDGAPAAADVSLSHHGRYLAWAVRPAP